jgi:hypothetical protein
MAYTFAKYILCDFSHEFIYSFAADTNFMSEANYITNITLQEVGIYIPHILLNKNTMSKQSSIASCIS